MRPPRQLGWLLLALAGLAVAVVYFYVPSAPDLGPVGKPKTMTAAMSSMPDNLASLQAQLAQLGKASATATIRHWLASGRDAPTGQGFALAPDGSLKQAPTLRTALLNALIQSDPAAAATYARQLLTQKTSADEWALALRAVALGDSSSASRTLLQQKFRELLATEAWRQNPSVGFLEAFDVAVFTQDTALTPDFAQLVCQTNNPALTHAAYLALDRLVDASAAAVLEQLQSHPEWLAGRETTRADYFARADVREPSQRAVLESYLLDPGRSAAELQQFAGVFPNANYRVSYNLLTSARTPTGAELAARDQATLPVVEAWLADPRFAPRQPCLAALKKRLAYFLKSPITPP